MVSLASALAAAHSDDARTRQDAAMVLGAIGTDDAAREIVGLMLREPDDHVRETLIWAVVARGEAALPALLESLTDPATEPERVLHTLSKIGDPATVPAILPFVDHPDRAVASKAWWALGRIGGDDALPALLPHLGRGDADRREGLTRALLAYGPGAIDGLTAALEADDTAVRRHAAEVLARLADPQQYARTQRDAGHAERAAAALGTSPAAEIDDVLVRLDADQDRPGLAAVAESLLADRAARA